MKYIFGILFVLIIPFFAQAETIEVSKVWHNTRFQADHPAWSLTSTLQVTVPDVMTPGQSGTVIGHATKEGVAPDYNARGGHECPFGGCGSFPPGTFLRTTGGDFGSTPTSRSFTAPMTPGNYQMGFFAYFDRDPSQGPPGGWCQNDGPLLGVCITPFSFGATAVIVVQAPPSSQCSDSSDNDGDGLTDTADPQCHSDCNVSNPLTYVSTHNSESVSPNGSCPAPTGNIYAAGQATAYQCTVPLGNSLCSPVNISWNTTNATTPVIEINNGLFDGGSSGAQLAPWIHPGNSPYVFNLRNNNVSGAILDVVTVTAVCASGSTWTGAICAATPPTTYSCTAGDSISNAGLCSGDDAGLSANTPNSLVNTCGPAKCEYTCDIGYELNGSGNSCIVSSAPAASLNAPDCDILAGQNRCTSNVSWSTVSIASPSIRQNGTEFSTLSSSGGTSRLLLRGTYTFTVFDGVIERASDTATAECVTGTTWDGDSCEVSVSVSGSISASPNPCEVVIGASTCTSNVSWSTSGATTPGVWTSIGGLFSSLANSMGTYPSPTVRPDAPVTLNLRNNNSSGTILDSVTITAECELGSAWNGSSCQASAVSGSISANPLQCDVAIGASTCTSSVSWNTSGATTPGVWTSTGVLFSSNSSGVNVVSPVVSPDASVVLNLRNNNSAGAILDSVSITAICTPGSTWTAGVCVASSLPNLSSNITPQLNSGSLDEGQSVTFRGQVKNTGTTNIKPDFSFSNNFTHCWNAGCSPSPMIGSDLPQSSINAGISRNDISASFNLARSGTLRVQHCVDSTPSFGGGSVAESDETTADNCKTETFTVNPTSLPGTEKLIICPVTNPVTLAVNAITPLQAWYWANFSGTPTCSDIGSATADVTSDAGTSWSSGNTSVVTVSNGGTKGVLTGLAVGSTKITATYSGLSDNKNVNVTTGMVYDPPTITIESKPSIVRSGQTARVEITIEADYLLTCTLSGALAGSPDISHDGTVTKNFTYTRDTVPLTAARVARVVCSDPNRKQYPKDITISVIPTFQEI